MTMTKKQIKEIEDKSGLIHWGTTEDGEEEFGGTIEQWRIGEPLIYKANLES